MTTLYTLLFSGFYGSVLAQLSGRFYFSLAGGFSGYFLLGYVLSVIDITPKLERLIYSLGIAGFIMTVVFSLAASIIMDKPDQRFYDAMSINIMLESAAVFVYFRQHNVSSAFISRISRYSLGAYLIHAEVIRQARLMNLFSFCPLISVPVVSAMILIISFAVSALLNHIPVVRKYIV